MDSYNLRKENPTRVRFSQKQGISVKDLGWARNEPASGGVSITHYFVLSIREDLLVERILIEDISGNPAVVLISEEKPKLAKGSWRGEAQPLGISKDTTPWVYTKGETIRSYQIKVTLAGKDSIELTQPLPVSDAYKIGLRFRSKELLKAIMPPRDPLNEMFSRSVSALLPPEEDFLLIQLLEQPVDTLAAKCLTAAKQARSAKRPVAIACENDAWATELVALMLAKARKGSLKGMTLVVVSPQISNDRIVPLTAGHDLLVKTGPLIK